MNEALEQVRKHLVPHDQPAEVLQPGVESFDLPAAFVAAQFSTILGGRLLPILAVRADQFGALFRQPDAEWIAVRSSIINQSWQLAFEDAGEDHGDLLIPVSWQLRKAVQATPGNLFLGVGTPGEQISKAIELTADPGIPSKCRTPNTRTGRLNSPFGSWK